MLYCNNPSVESQCLTSLFPECLNIDTEHYSLLLLLQNVNDKAPVVFTLITSIIFSTLVTGVPMITLSCTDPDRDHLTDHHQW